MPTKSNQRPLRNQNPSIRPNPSVRQAAALYSQGRYQELFQLARKELAADARNVEFLDYAALCASKHGLPEQAELFWKQALAIQPGYAKAHKNLGDLLTGLKRFDEAETRLRLALAIQPDDPEAHFKLGNLFKELDRLDEAAACYRRALAIQPDSAAAHYNLGIVLKALERLDEAEHSYRRALAIRPDFAVAHYNLGNLLKQLRRYEEALASYDQAQTLQPGYAEAHMNESLCRLLIGDFARGWPKHEWRWRNKTLALKQRNFEQPLWLGEQPVAGKTILLHAEQGFGDTVQFCRYAKAVAELGARVVLEVQPPLQSLLASLDGVSQLLAAGETLPPFDLHCPLLSLPLALRMVYATIPAEVPYLRADPARVVEWSVRLGAKHRPRVGLAWSGNAAHPNDHNRSIPLQRLLPLLSPDIQWVCLQKELRPDDRLVLYHHPEILSFAAELDDFADTAALLQSMDLVISVDTAVAHLAGALARPVWLLLPFAPDWRWLLERDDSPWYPTARLFRQTENRDWDAPVERIKNQLMQCLGKPNALPRPADQDPI